MARSGGSDLRFEINFSNTLSKVNNGTHSHPNASFAKKMHEGFYYRFEEMFNLRARDRISDKWSSIDEDTISLNESFAYECGTPVSVDRLTDP